MNFITLLLSFFLMTSSFAQDAVIAVGQAEQDKDKLVIDDSEFAQLTGEQKRLALEFLEILRNDFVFYKHRFNTVDYAYKGENSFTRPNLEKWATQNVTYMAANRIENGPGEDIEVHLKVWSVISKKELLSQKIKISKRNLRPQSHFAADLIYQSIVGKPSIFNSKIFFVSDRTSIRDSLVKEIYVMDFDGRRVERVTHLNSVVISPSLSPDNSKLMFSLIETKKEVSRSKVRFIKNIDLKLYDLKSKRIQSLSEKPGINSGAIFGNHPDKIYLTLSFTGNADIFEMTLSTGQIKKVTAHFSDDVDPSVNQNGSLMTFLSNRSGRAHIYTMDPSSPEKDLKRISFVGQFNATPRFSPDGKEIVFTSWVDRGFDLYRISADGNNLSRLTKNFGSNQEPVYSPDGEFIIFSSKSVNSARKATQDLYIMNREGEILGQLTQGFGQCTSPQWSNLLK